MSPQVQGRDRLFKGFNDLLDAAPGEILSRVQTAEAFPVVDLSSFVQESVATLWHFQRANNVSSGGSSSEVSADPFTAGDWANVWRDGTRLAAGGAVPDTDEFFVTSVGTTLGGLANFERAAFFIEHVQGGTDIRQVLHVVDSVFQPTEADSLAYMVGGPEQVPFPWRLASGGDRMTLRHWMEADGSAGSTTSIVSVRGYSLPFGFVRTP